MSWLRRKRAFTPSRRARRSARSATTLGSLLRTRRAPLLVGLACLTAVLFVSCLSTSPPPEDTGAGDPLLLGFHGQQPTIDVGVRPDVDAARIAVAGPFRLVDPEADAESQFSVLAETIVSAPDTGGLVVGAWRYESNLLEVIPLQPGTPVLVEGRRYLGSLVLVRRQEDKVAVINRVGLEDYLAGVIGNEMPLGWPDDALHAQAVAARTYALFHLRTANRKGAPYDVRADTGSQVYRGVDYDNQAQTARARKLVEETAGVVLTWRDRIFEAFFHSTCGGNTTSALAVFGGPDLTPLSGAQCGFCETSKYHRWAAGYTESELVNRLRAAGQAVPNHVSNLRVSTRGPGGRAVHVTVTGQSAGSEPVSVKIGATKVRKALGYSKLRSTWFDVTYEPPQPTGELDGRAAPATEATADTAGRWVFNGRGWGHGVGMCQVGCRGLAKAGQGTAEILRRYYPGSQLVRAY